MRSGITCIIPAFNEGEGIYETILEIDSVIKELLPFTIFVSEDGSVDNTREEILRAARDVEHAQVVLSDPSGRLGYSRAVQRGILECETEFICFMDADGQCDPKDIKRLFEELELGIVVGYRHPRVDGLNRIFYSQLFGIVYRVLGGPKRIDPSSPLVMARTLDIQKIAETNFHLNFGFWWEFQWRIECLGIQVFEIPANHRKRLTGKTQVYQVKKLPKIVFSHLKGLLMLRNELRKVA